MWILAQAIVQTVAIGLWLAKGLWKGHWAWVLYGLAVVVQTWAFWLAKDARGQAGIWEAFAPWMLLLLVAATLELFVHLSRLYKRFQRDRWKWLVWPVMAGAVLGLALVGDKLRRQPNFYKGMFLAEIWVGVVLSAILVLCLIASIPAPLPGNLLRHFTIIAAYVSVQAFAYFKAFDPEYQNAIRNLMTVFPPVILLVWAFAIGRGGDHAEGDSPGTEAPLSEIKSDLLRIHRSAGR